MSQAGTIEAPGGGPSPPDVPTEFITDSGSAVPIVNQLEVLGDINLAGFVPVETTGSGNTVTIKVQLAQSNAFSSSATAGLATFDATNFNVDANGFVTFTGSTVSFDSINVDASAPPGTDPVVPDGAGLITMTGRQVPSLGVGAQVLRTNSIAANSLTYEIQQAGAVAAESTNYNGVAHFDSSKFTVSNGFVSALASLSGIVTINGDTGSVTGSTVTIYANNAANNAGSTVKFVNSGTTSTLNLSDSVNENTIIGNSAGNATLTAQNCTALGSFALNQLTTGNWNTCIGDRSGLNLRNGLLNASIGWSSLNNCVSGSYNVAVGAQALANVSGSLNIGIGHGTMVNYLGDGNIGVGHLAGRDVTGAGSIAIGYISLVNNATGANNTACGYQSLTAINGGANNTAYGYNSGAALTTTDSGNIMLGYDVQGTAGDNNVTRIGKNQTTCYVQGIAGNTVANEAGVTVNTATGQLGVAAVNYSLSFLLGGM